MELFVLKILQAWDNSRNHNWRSVSLYHFAGSAGLLPATTETPEKERNHEENSSGT